MPRCRLRTHSWLALIALVTAPPAFGQVAPGEWQTIAIRAHADRDFGGRDAALRQLAQQRRHVAAQFCRDLSPAQSLDVYSEVVVEIAERTQTSPGELFAAGIEELARAIESPRFLQAHCTPHANLHGLRTLLRCYADKRPDSAADARELTLSLMRDWRAAGCQDPQAVALELIAGACAAIDSYTHFDFVPSSVVDGSGVTVVSSQSDAFEIRIRHFSATTPAELASALRAASQAGVDSLTLDLGGNPGGSLDAAAQVCGQLLGGGTMGRTRFGPVVGTGPQLYCGAVTVRVDAGTASAAEFVAATLQERGRAWIVGEPTFGKGRIQTAPIALSQGYLTVTVAELTTAEGIRIERRGVTPDAATAGSILAAR